MEKAQVVADAAELKNLLDGNSRPLLLDVRLEDDFTAGHIRGAQNNCVFEVTFLERMAEIAPELERPICVYGAGEGSLESRMAAEKLCRSGYQEVHEFPGGMDTWRSAGFSIEESGTAENCPPIVADGRREINLEESRVCWIGRNLLNHHEGNVAIKSGWLEFRGGKLAAGSFVIDMNSINCRDLEGDALHDVLIRHLLDHDFFDSGNFPEAIFTITGANPLPGANPGSPDLRIDGVMELKGVSRALTFDACTGVMADGRAAAQATLAIDRTLWNVLYGSGKWFRRPGGHLVNDLIELQLRIVGS